MNENYQRVEISKRGYLPLFLQRYPKYTFFLKDEARDFSFCRNQKNELNLRSEKQSFLYSKTSITDQHRNWFASLEGLDETELVYIYGLGLGYSYGFLKSWQLKRRGRNVFFIEDDLAVFSLFLKTSLAKIILQDPSFHIFLKLDIESDACFIDQMCSFLPTFKAKIFAAPHLKKKELKKFVDLKDSLLRSQIYFAALQQNDLHFNQIFDHFWKNIEKIPSSFYVNALKDKFKNIPAIICGAGPSLFKEKELLKTMKDRALILAGGSAITALSSYGISPHFGVIIDPNQEEVERMKGSHLFELPIIYTNRVHPEVFNTFNGPLGYIRSSCGAIGDLLLEQKLNLALSPVIGLDFSREALSVTSHNLAIAHFLGCSPIIFLGVDLAYVERKRYTEGVVRKERNQSSYEDLGDLLLDKKNRNNQKVRTCLKWIMESSTLSAYVQKFNLEVYDGSGEGLGFEAIPFRSLLEFSKKNIVSFDLDGKVHAAISQAGLSDRGPLLDDFQKMLKESLTRCREHVFLVKEELKKLVIDKENTKTTTPLMIVSKSELDKEIGYIYFLRRVHLAIIKHLKGFYKPWREGFKDKLKMEYDLWRIFDESLEQFIKTVKSKK